MNSHSYYDIDNTCHDSYHKQINIINWYLCSILNDYGNSAI